ncbi:unnamed protein product [Prorocentrum cordatum]|uniref:Subtilisin n=1 Tax=Prorocentrum cordatum TaxID=2364126 RepID=A0ABN9YCM1_9DINO|nr:unnamed protein product [Polarella glacialis]
MNPRRVYGKTRTHFHGALACSAVGQQDPAGRLYAPGDLTSNGAIDSAYELEAPGRPRQAPSNSLRGPCPSGALEIISLLDATGRRDAYEPAESVREDKDTLPRCAWRAALWVNKIPLVVCMRLGI